MGLFWRGVYYSDIDGDWNSDGDSNFGKPGDGVDMYPDIFVGMASVNTPNETKRFVDKVLKYEKEPPTDYELKALFMAEWLDEYTDSGICKDMIGTESILQRFNTTRLYKSNGNLNRNNAISSMNSGQNLINRAGHASYNIFISAVDSY